MMDSIDANRLVREAVKIAEEREVALSIAVCDTHGELVAFYRMNGVGLQTGPLARAKAYTAARMRKSTHLLGKWSEEHKKDISNWVDPQMTCLGGGLPIVKSGLVIGGMGVSGLSPEEDEEVVALASEALLVDTADL
ncbi:GlcG/HbpS family heme-binding protein [Marinoscillum furvescens]|uniref:Glc operon protein GlcG n=1 Tax=Marinoscillum furvescens DSM 4134 TaxID=1122208 RepID=A0A3D9L555_MARFU|nr:heme-binding protein [Marinoscillum furvescens]REE00080.1 glc operon protein GlcG [Marinoscillum furvescens DSM 4134]